MLPKFDASVAAITDACARCDKVNELMALRASQNSVVLYQVVFPGESIRASIAEGPVTAVAIHRMLATIDGSATAITEASGRRDKVNQLMAIGTRADLM
jgi:hypothetical protein